MVFCSQWCSYPLRHATYRKRYINRVYRAFIWWCLLLIPRSSIEEWNKFGLLGASKVPNCAFFMEQSRISLVSVAMTTVLIWNVIVNNPRINLILFNELILIKRIIVLLNKTKLSNSCIFQMVRFIRASILLIQSTSNSNFLKVTSPYVLWNMANWIAPQ